MTPSNLLAGVYVKVEDKMASRTKKGRFLSSRGKNRCEACKQIGTLRKKEKVESAFVSELQFLANCFLVSF